MIISYSTVVITLGVILLLLSIIYMYSTSKDIDVYSEYTNIDVGSSGLKAKISFDCEKKPLTTKEHKLIADIVLNLDKIRTGTYLFPKELHPKYDPFKDVIVGEDNSPQTTQNSNEIKLSEDDSDYEDLI